MKSHARNADGNSQGSTADKLTGLFAPVTTPFRGDFPDLAALRSNLRRLGSSRLTGYLALGSNGEFRSLSDAEQLAVLEVFAAERSRKIVMVGTGCESTVETIEKSRRAAEMGFDFASVLTPCYFPSQLTDSVLVDHFRRAADGSPIPLVLYNAPGFTGGMRLSPEAVRTLAAHGNVTGMKDSSAAGPFRFLSELNGLNGFAVLSGSANFFYPSLYAGAAGGVLSMANYLPDACCELYDLYGRGDVEAGRRLHLRIVRLNGAVAGRYGVAGVKAAMEVMGFTGGSPRSPLRPLTEEQKTGVREALEREGFLP